MIQSFRRCKIDINDTLFSKIIRHGKTRCQRCQKVKTLQAAHIIGRGSYSTRFMLEPVRNAISLCSDCHVGWFDKSKDNTPIFDDAARRYFKPESNAYAFLVENCGYLWKDLQRLYLLSQQRPKIHYKYWKKEQTRQLREYLDRLEKT